MHFQLHRHGAFLFLLILFSCFSPYTLSINAAELSKKEADELSEYIQEQFLNLPMRIVELEEISLHLANRIEVLLEETKSNDWNLNQLTDEINARTDAVISERIKDGTPSLIKRKTKALRTVRNNVLAEIKKNYSGNDRDKFLEILQVVVKPALHRLSEGKATVSSEISQETVRLQLKTLSKSPDFTNTAARFARGLETLLGEVKKNESWDTTTILSNVKNRSNKAFKTLAPNVRAPWEKETKELISEIRSIPDLDRKKLVRLLREEVLPALSAPSLENGSSSSTETEFGFKKYIIEQAKIYPPDLDFYRFNTALDIANFYEEHADDFANSTDPNKLAIELNKKVHELAAQKSRPSAEADNHAWKTLLQVLRMKRSSLLKEDRFDLNNPAQWRLIYRELADGFKELSQQYQKSRDLTEEQRKLLNAMAGRQTTTTTSSGSNFSSDQYLDAYSLKRALRYQRKKLHYERKLRRLPQR